MTKILFTTPTQPYPTQFCNDSLTDLTGQRLTKGQDIFTLSGHMHCHGVHFIAQNISAPSVFLEYPTQEGFETEVRKGYDFVGITFFATCMEIVLDMCKLVRRLSPNSKIVLGGYGGLAFNAAFPEDFKKEHADYVCIGEGVHFFRKLLGDAEEAPIKESHLPRCGSNLLWLDRHPRGNVGFILAGLGCPSACDFCATTEMHGNARIMLYEPEKIFQEMKRIYRTLPDTQQVLVYDEDYMKYTDEVRELGRLIREDTEFGLRKLNWFSPSSIQSLNQYDWDELALTGYGGTFIGIESKFAPQEGYDKRTGDAKETVEELHKRGIVCTGGWMAGFEFHDRVNIYEDLNYYISIGLVSKQISRVSPYPGTPLWYRLKEEGRLLDVPWEDQNFYGGGYKYKNFEPHELESLILQGYQKYYETWGPSLMRQLRVELNGYEYCRDSSHRLLREERSQRHRDACYQLYPTIKACEHFAPNGLVRRKIRQLEDRYLQNFGRPNPSQVIQANYVWLKALQEKMLRSIFAYDRGPKQEPFKKFIYEKNGKKDGPPYKLLYPQKSSGYNSYRSYRDLKEGAFGKVLNFVDQLWGTEIPGKAGASTSVRMI